MRSRRSWFLMAGAAVFFLNPALACMGGEDEFQFGAAEMRAAIEGTWQAALTLPDGTQSNLTFSIRQGVAPAAQAQANVQDPSGPALLRAASACGSRDLVRSAAACISNSSMPLEGQFVSGDETHRTSVIRGHFTVLGLAFQSPAVTSVDVQIGESLSLRFSVSPQGEATNLSLVQQGAPAGGTATLVRTSTP